jgi:hypothetical protein
MSNFILKGGKNIMSKTKKIAFYIKKKYRSIVDTIQDNAFALILSIVFLNMCMAVGLTQWFLLAIVASTALLISIRALFV